MFRNILGFINDRYKSVYYQYRINNKFTISNYFILLIKSLVDLIFFILQKFPGPLGIYLRKKIYKLFFKKVKKNLIIRENVKISDLSKLSIGDNVLISENVSIYNDLCEYYIGSNSHIGPGVIFGGRNNIIVGNNVGISSGCHIYSGGVKLKNTKKNYGFLQCQRMSEMVYMEMLKLVIMHALCQIAQLHQDDKSKKAAF